MASLSGGRARQEPASNIGSRPGRRGPAPGPGHACQWGLVHTREWIKPADLNPAELLWGFRRRADRTALPDRRVVVRFEFSRVPASRTRSEFMWLVADATGWMYA